MPLMMTQESSVEVPFNKAVLGAWIARCLDVDAVRDILGDVAYPSARVSSAHVNKTSPTFCGDCRGDDIAAEIVAHSHRVTELNSSFKKAESQRNKEKASKEKAIPLPPSLLILYVHLFFTSICKVTPNSKHIYLLRHCIAVCNCSIG
jgi:hypothetical protein